MARPLVSDALWEIVEPLLPKVPRRFKHPGRKRIPDRQVLTGVLFVLQTGIPWEYLAQENGLRVGHDVLAASARVAAGRGVGATARGAALKAALCGADRLVKAAIDSSHVRAVGGARKRVRARGSGPAGFQAPLDHLRAGQPARRRADRRQRQRPHPGDPAHRRRCPSSDPVGIFTLGATGRRRKQLCGRVQVARLLCPARRASRSARAGVPRLALSGRGRDA